MSPSGPSSICDNESRIGVNRHFLRKRWQHRHQNPVRVIDDKEILLLTGSAPPQMEWTGLSSSTNIKFKQIVHPTLGTVGDIFTAQFWTRADKFGKRRNVLILTRERYSPSNHPLESAGTVDWPIAVLYLIWCRDELCQPITESLDDNPLNSQ